MPNPATKRLLAFPAKPIVRRSLIGLVAFLLLITVFGFLILPLIIKSQAQHLIADKLGRAATIDKVEVNPFKLTVMVRGFSMKEAQGDAEFAGFEALKLDLSARSMLRLAPIVQEVRLTRPSVHLAREGANRYNIDDIISRLASQPPSEEPARFSINNIQVEDGRVRFEDKPAGTSHAIADIKLGVPFVSSLPSDVEIFVEPLLSAKVNDTPLLLKGKARPFAEPKEAIMELNLDGVDLTRYMHYLPFEPRFKMPSARLDLHLTASFRQSKDKAPALVLAGTTMLQSLRLTELDGKPVLKLPKAEITLGNIDVFSKRFEVARLTLDGLEADIIRGRDSQLNVMRLLPPARQEKAATAVLQLGLGELQIHDATVRYADEQPARPLRASVDKLQVTARKLALDTGSKKISIAEVASGNAGILLRQLQPAQQIKQMTQTRDETGQKETQANAAGSGAPAQQTGPAYTFSVSRVAIDNWSARLEDESQPQAATTVAPLSLSLQNLSTAASATAQVKLRAVVNKTGRVALDGALGLDPVHAELATDLKTVDLLPLQPYLGDKINLRLTRANLSGNGNLQVALAPGNELKGGFKGNVTVGNLATVDKVDGRDFLRWGSLSMGGMDVRLAPFSLEVDQVALNDFFARVTINPNGRINLQDVTGGQGEKRKGENKGGAGAASVPSSSAPPSRAVARAPDTAMEGAGKMPPITVGKLILQGGSVRFTDNFIKPNYTARLKDFGGVVTGLSSQASSNANVDLRGEVNGAPLAITGRINPLRQDLFLDIKANVRGMELPSLSSYSGRYIGYGIEKGKISFEASYLVENRKLTAENRLILEQLTFGEKIDSPGATRLPVQFAVALLSDRNGVIDINLPVAGSLDDPQFSVGGVIFKAIMNTIAKAVTQPFAMLGSLFSGSGGEEMASLDFEPGRSAIPVSSEARLRSLAKVLAERPALKLEITGRVDPDKDREGLKRASVERKVRAMKLKQMQSRGETAEPGNVIVQPQEYPALLARVYKEEKFAKPLNLIGLQKDLPVQEMEKLMIANAQIGDDDLVTLGNRRAQIVKDWLQKNGEVAAEKIFLLAAKSNPPFARVDFSLR